MNRLFSLSVGCLSFFAALFLTQDVAADHHHYDYYVTPSSSFGAFYTEATSTIATNAIIPLSAIQASSSDIQLNGSGVITLNLTGYYFVDFGASQSSAGQPLQVQLCLDGIPVTGAVLASDPAPAGLLSASTIIHVTAAGTLLTLQNTNSTDVLDLGNGIADTPTAFLTITKL